LVVFGFNRLGKILFLKKFADEIGIDGVADTVCNELAWTVPFLERVVGVVGFSSDCGLRARNFDISAGLGQVWYSMESIEAEGSVNGDHLDGECNSW
jgi:hypothetical protein